MSYGNHSYGSASLGGSSSFRIKVVIIKTGKAILSTLGAISVLLNKEGKIVLGTKTEK